MVQVVWSRQAIDELNAIRQYVEQFNFLAAQRLAQRLMQLGESLSEFPERGTPISLSQRQLTMVRPYLLRYRYDGTSVRILTIRHSARSDADIP